MVQQVHIRILERQKVNMERKIGEVKYQVETVLYELYRMRGLTSDQLVKVIFDNKKYAMNYLGKLKKEGLIVGKVYGKGKKRMGMQYFVTDKGIEYLEQLGMVRKYTNLELEKGNKRSFEYELLTEKGYYIPRKTLAYENNQGMKKDKMMFTIYTNEIYAGLTPYGIYVYDSREWKMKYGMNRNSFVRGGLKMKDGREYSLYILFSENEMQNAKLTENMLKRIYYEIEENGQSKRHIIYVYGENDYLKVLNYFRNNVIAGKELLIIPHGTDDIGLDMIRMLVDEKEHMANLEKELNVRLINGEELENETAMVFSNYLTEQAGQSFYVVDYLRLDELKLNMLERQYTRERYKAIGKEVILLCWSFMEEALSEEYQVYDYITVKGIDINKTLEWMGAKEVIKLQQQN